MNGGGGGVLKNKKNTPNSVVLLQEDLKTIKVIQNFEGKALNTGPRPPGVGEI